MNSATRTIPAYAFGESIQGGFFAGTIQLNDQLFGIVVAPAADGQHLGEWGKYGSKIEGAQHVADGLANTEAMANAGSEIAVWARGLQINGHRDWYIPARDELELIYRNLKPSAQENICGFRDGDNPSSIPPGTPYSEEFPTQTNIAAFQEERPEAMEQNWYWTSTQYSAYYAFVQDFSDGYQFYYDKVGTWRVRAVRRVLIN